MSNSQGAYYSQKFIVPANGTLDINISGSFVRCLAASLAAGGTPTFLIALDSGQAAFFAQGIAVRMAAGATFSKVTLDNSQNASILTTTLGYGVGNIEDDRLALSSAGVAVSSLPYAASGVPTQVTLAGGAAAQLLPANAGRKSATIRNNNAAGGLQIFLGEDNTVVAASGFPVDATGAFTIDHQGAVWAICTGAADVRVWEEV